MPRTVHVISPVAGTGNRLDLELVCPLLEQNGFGVIPYPVLKRNGSSRLKHVVRWLLNFRGRVDINLFMGPLFPEWLPFARKNLWIPNPEGFHEEQRKYLPRIDLVLAKTRLTERIFRDLGRPTEFISFTSRDQLNAQVPRAYTSFLHAGSSPYKGTKRLLETWQAHPEWPELTVVNRESPDAPNIRAIRDYLPDDKYRDLQNAHGFHLCCSEAEGFGHYLMEALSCGAVTLTTDGAPMNELVQPPRGILVKCLDDHPPVGLSHRCYFDPENLGEAIRRAQSLDETARREIGTAARAFFLENDRFFRERFIDVMKSL
jgi:glycosyltransferase involved in cell wall biosynthesis